MSKSETLKAKEKELIKMKEYEVVRKSDNETIDIVFGYSKADAFKRSGYDPESYSLVGGWYAD